MIQKVAKNHLKSMEAILAQNNSETKFESTVSTALINHLKQLNKVEFPLLYETLNNVFGEQLYDESFTKWLSCKLQIRHSKFNEYHSKWRRTLFSEIRGRQELSQNIKQNIYDTWIKNSINSTDGRNGRNLVKLSKRKYIEQYGTIENNKVAIDEVKNKHGQIYYSANRMAVTCTIRSIQGQLSQQGIVVSYGKIISLRPFFITFATEKEIAFCLCELCLNTRMLFEPLIAQAKRDNVSLARAKSVKIRILCHQLVKCLKKSLR